jgi:hypothetical protein
MVSTTPTPSGKSALLRSWDLDKALSQPATLPLFGELQEMWLALFRDGVLPKLVCPGSHQVAPLLLHLGSGNCFHVEVI